MKKIRLPEANQYKYEVLIPFKDETKLVEKEIIARQFKNNHRAPLSVRRWWFIEKDEILRANGTLTRLEDFVKDLFPAEYLQDATLKKGETDGKGCILMTTRKKHKNKDGSERQIESRTIIKNDYKGLREAIERGNASTLIFPFTVFGKRHKKENAHETHAIVIDIDYVGTAQMKNIIHQIGTGHILAPTYITSSGNGVHLWYFLDKPLNMTIKQGQELRKFKRMLIRYLWNEATSMRGEVRDSANAYQGFRAPEAYTKLAYDENGALMTEYDENNCNSESYRATCYKMNHGRRYSIRELKEMLPQGFDKYYVREYDYNELPDMRYLEADLPWEVEAPKSKMSLEEAKEKYPEWYARKIEGKEVEKKPKTGWFSNIGLYEWWKNKVYFEAVVGGRYYAIRALAQFGMKCGVSEEQIRRDAYSLMDRLNQISFTDDEADMFTEYDMECALSTLHEDITTGKKSTRKFIEETTHISIPPAKRNGRTRTQHMNYMNFRREELGITDWRCTNSPGAPTKEAIVKEWRRNNPEGTQYRCTKETGLSKNTVKKWWN